MISKPKDKCWEGYKSNGLKFNKEKHKYSRICVPIGGEQKKAFHFPKKSKK